jgi:hypothetical protein
LTLGRPTRHHRAADPVTPLPDRPGPEAADIAAIVATLTAALDRDTSSGALVRRDAHPKHHALLRTTVVVGDDVPADLRHGVFERPRRFEAWLRLSNGAPRVQPDEKKDQRGFALKLTGVEGPKLMEDERDATTQDFLLASAPRFFVRNVRDYVAFAEAMSKRPRVRALGFFFGLNPLAWRLHELKVLKSSLTHTEDLLATRYWSQVPSRLGPHVVKYSARPLEPAAPAAVDNGPDFLRARLASHLATHSARFEFLVQRQRDPRRQPVEDSTIEWLESEAPFERVATIEIPAQLFDSPAQMALAEHLSFTPWHTLGAHEPLGGVNRVRKAVYQAISAHRHARNGVPRREPSTLDLTEPVTP